ncbi:MAG TPA: aminotransferase class I/II-fold pyridoxal phosphate-dependent enzyme [Candidatus Thermoplasmatota archaeon]|nr:aminotransferase class I/II-fold pyridoxal phosphate-dependent enzyme [Candidatus Thermoplasmatota archaeon]
MTPASLAASVRVPLAEFDLHEWHNDHEGSAGKAIGGSGMPRADLTPFLPKTSQGLNRLWTTTPNDAIADVKAQLRTAYGFKPDEVLLTEGASEADFVTVLALAGPGAHVIVEQPAYFALLEPARSLGCRVTRIRRQPQNDFALDPDEVLRAITPGTRLICLARPNNPTGERIADEHLRAIAEAAARVDAYVLVDEVFAEATKEGDRPARRLHDRILSVNSLTKTLGFGPLHLGWVSGPPEVIENIHRAKAHTRPLNPILSLTLAARILRKRKSILAKTRQRRHENYQTVRRFLQARPGLEWHPHGHGTTTVFRLPKGRDDVTFATGLVQEENVLVTPASYTELPGWIRLGLMAEPATLRNGLQGLGRKLDK